MSAHVIDGRALSGELKGQLAAEVATLAESELRPGLVTLLVGSDGAAETYERRLRSLSEELGFYYRCERFPEGVEESRVIDAVSDLNTDPRVSGILLLKPLLSSNISEAAVYRALNPLKDVEAVHPVNAGLLALGQPRYVPSTPASCFYLLDRYLEDSGRDPQEFYKRSNVVVVGRSNNVGKPAVSLAYSRNATVVSCDEYTSYAGRLAENTREADVLIVAAGVANLIKEEHVREGVVAADIGINPVKDPHSGKTALVGDLDFEGVSRRAEAISPVPGGVGPITDVWLLKNTLFATRLSAGLADIEQR